MLSKAVIFGLCAAALAPAAAAAERAPLYVDKAGFDCLVRNIQSIGKARGETLLVDLATCPPKVQARLRSFPSFQRSAPRGQPQTMMLLTRADIACIAAFRHRLDRLRQPVDGGRYRVSLAVCSR
jgi:hypothetical protein